MTALMDAAAGWVTGGPTTAVDAPPAGSFTRLSESELWGRQRKFYDRSSEAIWGSGTVPHGITCNPRIANTYARISLELLRSTPSDPGAGDHLHLIEFGAGSGRFAYLLVRELRRLAPSLRFTYVLTDFAPERVESWAAHPSFRPLVEQGYVDFAALDAERPGSIELSSSGRRIGPGALDGPVIGIANYVFDTLRADCFAVRGGELAQLQVSVSDADAACQQPAPTTAAAVGEPRLDWNSAPLGQLVPDQAAVLAEYARELDDTAVLVPIAGIRCLEFLTELTTGSAYAVVADKGHATRLELCSQPHPAVVYHGSAFSLMVNFDFLARWVRARGGVAVLPSEPVRSLVVGAFALGPGVDGPSADGPVADRPAVDRAATDAGQLTAYVQDQLVDVGPDNFYAIRPLLAGATTDSLDSMLAALRLSRFDPSLLVELLPNLLEVLPTVGESQRNEIDRVLRRVWDSHFPIGEPIDMALCLGLLLSAIQRFSDAVQFLELSVAANPDSAPTAFSMAVARRGMRDLTGARDWANRALEIDPALTEARTLRAILADDLGLC